MEIKILQAKTNKPVVTLNINFNNETTIGDIKNAIGAAKAKFKDINRQELRAETKGKGLKDDETLGKLGLTEDSITLYIKDRGIQIGWTTVFLSEYAGPLFVYLLFYIRPRIIYGDTSNDKISSAAHVAAMAWSFHYIKRLLETIFVHRFSNATMPLGNLFKNCSYYWGFAAYIAYHINHPLYTPPSSTQVYIFLAMFLVCEFGNFTIHVLLRNLRPAGSKNFVSCPNYTYEIGAWMAFTLMTQCLPVGLFTVAGAYQMAIWALGKHRNYKKEFEKYPKRKAIFPFLL